MTDLKLLRNDILLQRIDEEVMQKKEGQLIVIPFNKNQDTLRFYNVLAIGPEVSEVKVGDTLLMNWSEMTPPFAHDNVFYQITDESKVLAVVDEVN